VKGGGSSLQVNVGGGNHRVNLEVFQRLLDLTGRGLELVRHVEDRPGHDRRYAIISAKLHALGWAPRDDFATALGHTVRWYREHEAWWRPLNEADNESFAQQYAQRLTLAEQGARGE